VQYADEDGTATDVAECANVHEVCIVITSLETVFNARLVQLGQNVPRVRPYLRVFISFSSEPFDNYHAISSAFILIINI